MTQYSDAQAPHLSVMAEEVLRAFSHKTLKVFFEGTVGAGGHARRILEAHPEIEHYIACDRDPEALKLAKQELEPWKNKIQWVHGNFADLDLHLKKRGIDQVDGFFLIWGCRLCN